MPADALVTISTRRQSTLATLPRRLEEARIEFRNELAKELALRVRTKLPKRTGELRRETTARVAQNGNVELVVQAAGGRSMNWVSILEDGGVINPKSGQVLRFRDRQGRIRYAPRVVIPRRRVFSTAVKAVETDAARTAFTRVYGRL
jgi:hypothetical protein